MILTLVTGSKVLVNWANVRYAFVQPGCTRVVFDTFDATLDEDGVVTAVGHEIHVVENLTTIQDLIGL